MELINRAICIYSGFGLTAISRLHYTVVWGADIKPRAPKVLCIAERIGTRLNLSHGECEAKPVVSDAYSDAVLIASGNRSDKREERK